MLQKYCPLLTHYPARNGQRPLGPGLLAYHPHMLPARHPYHSPWPRPLLLYEPEDYALTSDKVLEWTI